MAIVSPDSPCEGHGGRFVVSLDLELFWGVKDHVRLEDYRQNILGVRKAVPSMLSLFRQYNVHATWAAVGMLFFEEREQLLASLPTIKPAYQNKSISNYELISDVGKDEASDPYHYGASLISQILDVQGQEVGTHTFSHYYCLEPGQNLAAFQADLQAAQLAAKRFNQELRSIVFPRNQVNRAYLSACTDAGLVAYRGNPPFWWYQHLPERQEKRAWLRRGLRLADNYANISGAHFCRPSEIVGAMTDVPASRFLRPWSQHFRQFEPYRLRRIQKELEVAAENSSTYHLWWHPHNFGTNTRENLEFLTRILDCFAHLRERTGMRSLSMAEAARETRGQSIAAVPSGL